MKSHFFTSRLALLMALVFAFGCVEFVSNERRKKSSILLRSAAGEIVALHYC
jgi:hypothetical protein